MNIRDQIMMEMMQRRQRSGAPQGGPRGVSAPPGMPQPPMRPGGQPGPQATPQAAQGAPERPMGPQERLNQISRRLNPMQRQRLAGLLEQRAEAGQQNQALLNDARELYEEIEAYEARPDASTKRKWRQKGPQFLAIIDSNPALARRFVLSPIFRSWVRVNTDYEPPEVEMPTGVRTPGVGLLADEDAPAPMGSGGRVPMGGGSMA